MATLFSIVFIIAVTYSVVKLSKNAKKRSIEESVKKAHAHGRELIEYANQAIVNQIDLQPLKEINPELYHEIRVRERLRKDGVATEGALGRATQNLSALGRAAIKYCIIAMTLVVLAGCSSSDPVDRVMCTYNDDPIMESAVRDYYEQIAKTEIESKYIARCQEQLETNTTNQKTVVSGVINNIKTTTASGGSLDF